VAFCAALAAIAMPLHSQEEPIHRPPASREYCSASHEYCLVVRTDDGWKSKHATAELRRVARGTATVLWQKQLPQELGPRIVLVSDKGEVVCFDESIDVLSRMALMLFRATGAVIRQAGFSDIQATLGVPANTIVRSAKFGPWMMERPVLEESAGRAKVRAGGKTLLIRLSDGQLSAE
jgi:hypothetical protein